MNVLHVITGLHRGGAELMLQRLIMAQMDHPQLHHRVISLQSIGPVGEELRAAGVEVEGLGLKGLAGVPAAVWKLRRRIRARRPDIVQCWMYHADLIGAVAARLAGVRTILWGVRIADIFPEMGVPRSTLLIRSLSAALSRTLPRRIIYVAHSARVVHEQLGYSADRSVVIQNGYSFPSPAAAAAARERCRAELGIAPGELLIGSAGRFALQKGYEGFVRAAGELGRRHPQLRFLLAGREVTWDNRELAGWVRETGLADRFHLIGEKSAVHEWLAAMDVFVLNSLVEGFPNIVAEAMSVAVPCVVTDVGDAALLVGDTGTVIQPGDLPALTAAIEALAGDDALRGARSAAARARVEDLFSIETIAKCYEQLYVSLAPVAERNRPEAARS